MEINPSIFRGYDIRGVAGKDLDAGSVEQIGQAHGTYLQGLGVTKAVVGSDNRLTSDEYRAAVIKGLNETGIDVIDLGTCTTSIVYWAQYHFKAKGAVMITASHNPAEYNGMKLGKDLSDTLVPMDKIRELTFKKEFVSGEGKSEKAPEYIEAYYKELIEKAGEIKPFKVVVDASNGSAGKFVPKLLRKVGCEVIEQFCELDGSFPNGTPDPTESKIAQRLADRVQKEKADVGFSFDGDGDRIGLVDEAGGIIWNDVLVAIFSDDVISQNPGANIVYNALCSKVVGDVIEKAGGVPIMWLTGHAFIKAKVKEEHAPFGGELSGHFYFMDKFYGHDDGAYAALRVLSYLTRKGKKLSEIVATFPKYISSPEIKLACPDKDKFDVIHSIQKVVAKDFANEKVSQHDDPKADVYIRVDFSDGMFTLRPSQNGPYFTIKFEAKDRKTYNERASYIKTLLHKYPEIDWDEGVNTEVLK